MGTKRANGDVLSEPEHAASPAPETPATPSSPEVKPTPVAPTSARRLRAMAAVRWILLAAVSALASHTTWTYWGPPSRARHDARADRYYCPMHPQIRSGDPGECPICHMSLEPIPAERQQGNADPLTSRTADDAGGLTVPTPDAGALPALVPIVVALDRQQSIGVSTALVTSVRSAAQLRLPGVVEVPENATTRVHVRAAGYLERAAVRQTGVRVARGQVLAWVFSPQVFQTELELLRAHRWTAESAGRDGALLGVPGNAAEIARAGRQSLELLGVDATDIDAIVRSGEAMRAVPIRAQSSGYVMRFAAIPGSYVAPEMTLFEIADLSRVWIVASLYERDLPHVRPGMIARFAVPGTDAPTRGRVVLVEPDVAVATRTARVRVEALNPTTALRPGQYGEVLFELAASERLGVPRDAVIDTGDHRYVFVDLGGGRFAPRSITTGALIGDFIEVAAGLRAGERVVVRGGFMLDSESRLQASLAAVPASDVGPGDATATRDAR